MLILHRKRKLLNINKEKRKQNALSAFNEVMPAYLHKAVNTPISGKLAEGLESNRVDNIRFYQGQAIPDQSRKPTLLTFRVSEGTLILGGGAKYFCCHLFQESFDSIAH